MIVVRAALLVVAAASVVACQAHKSSYSAHDPRFVGTWYNSDKDPNEVHQYFQKTYFPDGTACGYIFSVNARGTTDLIVFKSVWQIKNGQLLSTVIASNSKDELPPSPVPIVDDIISIDGSAMRLHGQYDAKGYVYTDYKLQADKPEDLCRLYDAVTHTTGI